MYHKVTGYNFLLVTGFLKKINVLTQFRLNKLHPYYILEESNFNFRYVRLYDLIVLGFNDTSTLVGHFVSSPREREKRDSRGNERERQGRKRNRNEREETEEIKHSPSTLTCYKGSKPCPTVSQYQLDASVT